MLRITVNVAPEPVIADPTGAIMEAFAEQGGAVAVAGVKSLLGTEAAYHLDPGYAEKKPRRKGYRHISGKPPEEPLIFSGSTYEGVESSRTGENTIGVGIADDAGVSPRGDDYAELWEDRTQFIDRGVEAVEDEVLQATLEELVAKAFGL